MKLLHTADWHLGKRLNQIERLPEQREVLEEICEIADREQVDVIIIAGDLFDHINPSNEVKTLFYKTLKRLTKGGTRPVIAIAGNHDSPQLVETAEPLARECGIIIAGFPQTKIDEFTLDTGLEVIKSASGFVELSLPQFDYPLRVLLTPYANEQRMKKYLGEENQEEELRRLLAENWQRTADKFCDNKGVNILTTHLFVTKKGEMAEEEPEGEKSILHVGGAQVVYTENFPAQMQYVALGHLHRRQTVSEVPCPIVYSSSILGYSFAEENHTKYVMAVEVEPGKPAEVQKIALQKGKKLRRKTFDEVGEAVIWLEENPETLVELTIETDNYLTGQEQKILYQAHEGIVALIPKVSNSLMMKQGGKTVDLGRSTEELFTDYFALKNNGVSPSKEIVDLLKEILAEEG
ncbi:MAG: exonuclease SbcD [Saprospiraceae bacterium]|jgi:exonuclease SbcD